VNRLLTRQLAPPVTTMHHRKNLARFQALKALLLQLKPQLLLWQLRLELLLQRQRQ
jgi:hypothetical protein